MVWHFRPTKVAMMSRWLACVPASIAIALIAYVWTIDRRAAYVFIVFAIVQSVTFYFIAGWYLERQKRRIKAKRRMFP